MAKVINLRRARKAKARDAVKAKADGNAVKHGEPRDVKTLRAARKALDKARLDGLEADDD